MHAKDPPSFPLRGPALTPGVTDPGLLPLLQVLAQPGSRSACPIGQTLPPGEAHYGHSTTQCVKASGPATGRHCDQRRLIHFLFPEITPDHCFRGSLHQGLVTAVARVISGLSTRSLPERRGHGHSSSPGSPAARQSCATPRATRRRAQTGETRRINIHRRGAPTRPLVPL